MKSQCYAIFDTCSGLYEKPFFSTADALVKREFSDVANTEGHAIGKHPEHYSLWRLGGFDNLTGKLTEEANECLCTALEVMSQTLPETALPPTVTNSDGTITADAHRLRAG